MQRSIFIASIAIVLVMTGCSRSTGNANLPTGTASAIMPSPSYTPPILLSITATPAAQNPPTTPTKTKRTPLPTSTGVPTSTPAYTPNFENIVWQTATPAAPAICPKINPGTTIPIGPWLGIKTNEWRFITEKEIIDYLDTFGLENVVREYRQDNGENWLIRIQAYQDLTNDGILDLALGSGSRFYIVSCLKGKHTFLTHPVGTNGYLRSPEISSINDVNRNGVPEIAVITDWSTQGERDYTILEWDGKQFLKILQPAEEYANDLAVDAKGSLGIEDINHDGVSEYVFDLGTPVWETYQLGVPWRQERQYYRWDGKLFIFYKRTFSPPEYRFQAIQDGDRATRDGELEQAQLLYQRAIFDQSLGWWNAERGQYIAQEFIATIGSTSTPLVPPLPDPLEFDHLVAYARYRLMLLHIARGWVSDAKVVYDTLQKKYPEGSSAHIYATLAQVFWKEYMASDTMKQACLKTIKFAQEHDKEIYPYIGGSEYHGPTRIDYWNEPYYICPFNQ